MERNTQNLFLAIERGDVAKTTEVLATNPDLLKSELNGLCTWLETAIRSRVVDTVVLLLDKGCDVNSARKTPDHTTALESAIHTDDEAIIQLLLSRGADPNLGRPLIAALNERKPPDRRLALVKLLVEHGADANRLYDLYGDFANQFAALDWASDPAVIDYLRQHGAKTAAELKAGQVKSPELAKVESKPLTPADEVIRYFGEHFGPVDNRSLVEIVPTGHAIAIHAVRPEGNRKHLTLFTTGISNQPMATPPGKEDYSLAELFIQLPGDWPFSADCPPEKAWVLRWIRKIAQYPHGHKTWLGGPVTVIDNEDPPQPLGQSVPFTSWLLLVEKSFQRSDGRTVQLYRLMPLHRDERDLEQRKGAPALMRALDRGSVPFILDVDRKSVAGSVNR